VRRFLAAARNQHGKRKRRHHPTNPQNRQQHQLLVIVQSQYWQSVPQLSWNIWNFCANMQQRTFRRHGTVSLTHQH
jgi:hypothetical protein